MLVAGIVNPPPVADPSYAGVYFAERDDMPAQARALANKPLRVEHGDVEVGRVLNGWQDKRTGALCALAEIDVSKLPGALAATAVTKGRFGQFSLGYSSRLVRQERGHVVATDKRVLELSLVKQGARPNCHIAAHTAAHPYLPRPQHAPPAPKKVHPAPAVPPARGGAPDPLPARGAADCLSYWASPRRE